VAWPNDKLLSNMKFRAIFKSMVERNAGCYENAARIKLVAP
jgi:hypothetical protein